MEYSSGDESRCSNWNQAVSEGREKKGVFRKGTKSEKQRKGRFSYRVVVYRAFLTGKPAENNEFKVFIEL